MPSMFSLVMTCACVVAESLPSTRSKGVEPAVKRMSVHRDGQVLPAKGPDELQLASAHGRTAASHPRQRPHNLFPTDHEPEPPGPPWAFPSSGPSFWALTSAGSAGMTRSDRAKRVVPFRLFEAAAKVALGASRCKMGLPGALGDQCRRCRKAAETGRRRARGTTTASRHKASQGVALDGTEQAGDHDPARLAGEPEEAGAGGRASDRLALDHLQHDRHARQGAATAKTERRSGPRPPSSYWRNSKPKRASAAMASPPCHTST